MPEETIAPAPEPDLDEAPGWIVTDPDGNVVAFGKVSQAKPVDWIAEQIAGNSNEGDK